MVHALRADGAPLLLRWSTAFILTTYCVPGSSSAATAGYRVVLVSSGAIGVGCQRLKLSERPKGLAQKQALAAIGQVYLMRYYEDFFDALGLVRYVGAVPMQGFAPVTCCSAAHRLIHPVSLCSPVPKSF